MKKSAVFFLSTTMLLFGAVIGFLFASNKLDFLFGHRNIGNRHFGDADACCSDWDEDGDEDDMPF